MPVHVVDRVSREAAEGRTGLGLVTRDYEGLRLVSTGSFYFPFNFATTRLKQRMVYEDSLDRTCVE